MTSDAQRAAIQTMIKRHTATVTVSKRAALDSLIKEGVYNKSGKLTEQFGGKKRVKA